MSDDSRTGAVTKIRNSFIFFILEITAVIGGIIGLFFAAFGLLQTASINKTATITTAWDNLSIRTPGNSGKKNSIEILLAENQSLFGIDVSCDRMHETDEVQQLKIVAVEPQQSQLYPPQTEYKPTCGPLTYLADLQIDPRAGDKLHDLRHSNFTLTDLSNSKFSGVDLSDAKFIGSKLEGAVFTNVNLESASLANTDLRKTKIIDSDLKDVIFTGSSIDEETFRNVTIDGPLYFDDVTYYGVLNIRQLMPKTKKFTDPYNDTLNFARSNIGELIASDLTIFNANFTDFQKTNKFSGIADFSNSTLYGERSSFDRGQYGEVSFNRARLAGADFRRANLKGVVFRNTILSGANFSNAIFEDVVFENTNISGAIFCDQNGCAKGVTDTLLENAWAIENLPKFSHVIGSELDDPYERRKALENPKINSIEVNFDRLCSYDLDWLSSGGITLEASIHLISNPKIICPQKDA